MANYFLWSKKGFRRLNDTKEVAAKEALVLFEIDPYGCVGSQKDIKEVYARNNKQHFRKDLIGWVNEGKETHEQSKRINQQRF